ncbi:MAG TPA: ABC transporter ATP-binding protein [Pyrinomonadaceae bacterium]|jgi:lipopolysaccharide transport system ATP-binding protein|nr:ABC transporter ATP-binding protein [Pyrinomonadaceae bacterium]
MKQIIQAHNISKRYRIRAQEASYQTLRDAVAGAVKNSFTRRREGAKAKGETVWALKDINFEVETGEIVGLIGHNGAGKSTLLKILSRIVDPTTGHINLYGRIGSLLEVGTGFHPELTGRENLFLNGAILGMKRAEIARKFDEIVAFSEIEKFIDTPVKWYSSGMYLRLAFSVAVHLEPEILVLDEVLAVGDASFQIKCLNKMDEIRKDGRTILFVSHNMQAITRLCRRAIYLSQGTIIADGPAHQIASTYLSARLNTSAERKWDDIADAPGNDIARLRAVRVRNGAGEVLDTVDIRERVGVEIEYQVLKSGMRLVPNLHFYNEEGICLFIINDLDPRWYRSPRPAGRYRSTAWIPGNFLSEGMLLVHAALSTYDPVVVHFNEPEVVAFQVVDNLEGNSARGDYTGPFPGAVRPIMQWTTEREPDAAEDQLTLSVKERTR